MYCFYLLVTDANGKEISVDRGIYNGEMWRMYSAFPAEPTEYTLINTFTTAQTYTATETGWYKVEVFGASGRGGYAYYDYEAGDDGDIEMRASGGGGGSGAYASSIVKLKVDDTIIISPGAVGSVSTATVKTSIDGEAYDVLTCTGAGNGGSGTLGPTANGAGGAGGTASGGNLENINGNAGSKGTGGGYDIGYNTSANGGAGGVAVVDGGNAGGAGASALGNSSSTTSPGAGKAGFVKILRGNTNVS